MSVDKRWLARFAYEDRQRGRTWSNVEAWWTIEAFEDVTVPAGTFKAFKIQSDPGANNATRSTVWFAPDLGLRVKSIYERTANHYLGALREVSEMVELKRP